MQENEEISAYVNNLKIKEIHLDSWTILFEIKRFRKFSRIKLGIPIYYH